MAMWQLVQPNPYSTVCSRVMACVICEPPWDVCHDYAYLTASTSVVKLEVVTLLTLLDCESPNRLVPCDRAACVDCDVMWPVVGFDEQLYFYIGFSAGHFWQCVPRFFDSSLKKGLELNCMFFLVPYLTELC